MCNLLAIQTPSAAKAAATTRKSRQKSQFFSYEKKLVKTRPHPVNIAHALPERGAFNEHTNYNLFRYFNLSRFSKKKNNKREKIDLKDIYS